jgi:hypothetical protein
VTSSDLTPLDWTQDEVAEACLEMLATGRVLGVPIEADPEDLATRIGHPSQVGPEYHDLVGIGRPFEQEYYAEGLAMNRDWYLYKLYYSREHPHGRWRCWAASVRCQNLKVKAPRWEEIKDELTRYGYQPVPAPDGNDDLDRYQVMASAARVRVGSEDVTFVEPGRIYDVDMDGWPTPWTPPDRRGTIRNAMRALGKAGPGRWPGWLAERPQTPEEYAAVLSALQHLHVDQPARDDEWTELGLWFLDQARAAAVFPAGEWTYRWAQFVNGRPGLAPPAEVSRACLAALPMTIEQALAMPAGWRETPPDDARRARMTRGLLRTAADAAPDAAETAELERWKREPRWLH